MPQAIAIGISYSQFWDMNPRIVNVIVQGMSKKIEYERNQKNEFAWLQGMYICEALSSTVGNMFRGKSDKPYEYPQKPYEFDEKEHNLTEDEINVQRELFWQQLHIMQHNFELSKQGE